MPPVPATQQLRRLLVMIPWLVGRGGASLDELARAFGITVEQAEADVLRASMVRAGADLPEHYVNVFLDGDHAYAHPSPYLKRPPRLSAAQGFALLAAGKALADDSSVGGPLSSALAKLERVLGDPDIVSVDLQEPEHVDVVRRAVLDGTQLQIEYYAAWRDEVTDRVIEPRVVYQRHGRWYVQAWCHRAVDLRNFRIDRIRALTVAGTFEPAPVDPPPDVWDPGADAETVVVDIPLWARWVVEAYPVTWEERDGMLRVTMRVLGTTWLERLLLKVGPEASVVSPSSLQSVGADAAARLLEAYA
jgi:proteasome accessory factor C